MKQFGFLPAFLVIAVAAVLGAAPSLAQADEPAPNLVLTTLYFQYQMDDGNRRLWYARSVGRRFVVQRRHQPRFRRLRRRAGG